jgi:drug/metabolite transporter (DMT)-like permease
MPPLLQLHLVVLAWGFTAILGALIRLPAHEITVIRTALACVGLAVLARVLKTPLWLGWRFALKGTLIGLSIGAHWICFFGAAKLANPTIALSGMPTTMLWCSLMEAAFVKGKRLSIIELSLGILMILAGWAIHHTAPEFSLGFVVSLGCAVAGSIFAVINGQVAQGAPAVPLTFYEMLGGCLFALGAMPWLNDWLGPWSLPTGGDWFWLLVLSQVCTVGAFALYVSLLRHFSVFTINVAYNLEPVYGIIMSALIFRDYEKLTPLFYLATAVICSSVIFLPVLQRYIGANDRRQGGAA